jgi:hypothetical protein
MAEMKARKFRVVYEPDDGGWHVYVPEFVLPAGAKRELERAIAARKDADERASKAQAEAARAAKTLTSRLGLSLRDAGDLLGLSHERVKQLTQ